MARDAIANESLSSYEHRSYYPVLIMGAGASGIAMACQLKEQLGCDQFRVFDRQSGIGGTWWINRYPGVACDVPAIFYSFNFCPNTKWTTFHPPGAEIVKYLSDVCAKYQIVDKFELNTEITEARWLEHEEVWEVSMVHLRPGTGDLSNEDRQKLVEEHGSDYVFLYTEVVRAKVLVSAVGSLVDPRPFPASIPGRESFQGKIFHSARWDHSVDFNDKDVVVVGTGCSAAQFVPRLVEAPYNARSVTQLMRSPPWVNPAPTPVVTSLENYERWSPFLMSVVPGLAWCFRTMVFALTEWQMRYFCEGEWYRRERQKYEKELVGHLKKTVPERYLDMLTPDYAVGCKRRIFDRYWLPSLHNPKIELTTARLTSLQRRGVTLTRPPVKDSVAAGGEEQRAADVIVLANGFDVGEWLHPLTIRGKGGKYLHEVWKERGGAQAYLGAAMDGFPNMFMIFGPNTVTGHSSVILASESMVALTVQMVKPILNGDASQVEVTQEAEMRYTRDIQESLKGMVFQAGGCRSWYKTENGWNSTIYPHTQIQFWFLCRFVRWSDWTYKYTAKGLRKAQLRRLLTSAGILLAVGALLYARQKAVRATDVSRVARDQAQNLLDSMLGAGRAGLRWIGL